MAIQIIREVSADVVKRGATRAVYAKQNDVNSRFLNIRIQEDGKDIKVDSTSTVILNVERPDKQENMFYGTVNEDGTVRVPMSSWMLELEGTLLCDVSIVAEDTEVAKLTTMQFNIYVEAAVITDEAIIDTEEYSVIVDLLKRTSDAAAIAEEAAKDATTLKENCEEATDKANKAAHDTEEAMRELAAGGFIHSIKEKNHGRILSFWVGTQEEYDALPEPPKDCYVVIEDDDTLSRQNKVIFDGAQLADDFQDWIPGRESNCFFCGMDTENYLHGDDGTFGMSIRSYNRIEMDIIIKSYDDFRCEWRDVYLTFTLQKIFREGAFADTPFVGSYVRDNFDADRLTHAPMVVTVELGVCSDPEEQEYEIYMAIANNLGYYSGNTDDNHTLSEGVMQIRRIIGID